MIDNYEKSQIEKIEQNRNAYKILSYEIEQKEIMKEAMLEKCVSEIQKNLTIYDSCIEKAIEQRNNNKDKSLWKWLLNRIKEDFFPEYDCKFISSMSCGYSAYAYNFEYEYKGNKFAITIPRKNNITTENVEWAEWGEFSFRVVEGMWQKLAGRSYRIEELRDDIQEELKRIDLGLDVL